MYLTKIRRTVPFLRKTYGADWFKPHKISLAKLDINHSYNCVLGQLDENFYGSGMTKAYEQFGWESGTIEVFAGAGSPDDGDKMNDEWKQVIRELRNQDAIGL